MLGRQEIQAVLVVVLFGFVLYQIPYQQLAPVQIAGLIIAIPALLLWVIARLQLGSSFSVVAKARGLVTTGLYSKIRNPVYVFGVACITGAILYSNHLWWLLAVPVLLVVQVLRARKEAIVLEAAFGDEYRTWRATTWF
jgi:protein-S-isoprenylcysteine O-methyltransferase Ste14